MNYTLPSNKFNCIITALVLFSINIFGQDSFKVNKWNLNVGYATYNIASWKIINNEKIYKTAGNIRLEANYSLTKTVDVGLYVGYSKFELYMSDGAGWYFSKKCHTPFFGLNCNFHLLPYLLDKDTRFDLYLTGQWGGYYLMSPSYFFMHGASIEYGYGAGLSYNPLKQIGLYLEYHRGRYFFDDNDKLRYGLTFKF